jgi:hypothetical protein
VCGNAGLDLQVQWRAEPALDLIRHVADPKHPVFVEGIADGAAVTGSAWSPDGKQIAYCTGTFQFLEKEQLRDLESLLVVADPTGKNAKVIRRVKGESFNSDFWR